jgi:nucleotide-binding universal stress UspA family protein
MDAICRILCPVDLSDDSAAALERAAVLARRYDAPLTVLHVVLPAGADQDLPPGPAAWGRRAAVMVEPDVTASVGLEVQRFVQARVGPEVPTTTLIAEARDAAGEIARKADQLGADLIVMGAHGRGGFEPLLLGSTADMVLRRTHCPVLTSPPGPAHAASPTPFTSLLCAVDGPPASSPVFDQAVRLAADFAADLCILQVAPPPPDDGGDSSDRDASSPGSGGVADASGTRVERLVSLGRAAEAILRRANERRCDLIVIGSRNRGASDGFRVGRTTHHVVRAACCPVWTVPVA